MTSNNTLLLEHHAALDSAAVVDALGGLCIATSLEQNYPLFSRGRFKRTGKDRVQLVAVQTNVTINDATVSPSDIICADAALTLR